MRSRSKYLSLGTSLNACFWLDDARVDFNHVCCFEMVPLVGSILVLQSIDSINAIKPLCGAQ